MIKQEDTICYKVSRAIDECEKAIKTKSFDVGLVSKLLHGIRIDATRMESVIKLRKKLMEEAGIEKRYQKAKGKVKPTGINKIATAEEVKIGKEIFKVTIEREGEVVYQHNAHAGAVSLVEEIKDIDESGAIIGTTQKLIFGHPLAYWFAYDQLRQSVEDKNIEIMKAIGLMVDQHGTIDAETKNKVLLAIKKMNI